MYSESVYFIRSGRFTKIGRSTNVKQRLATLQTTSPEPLTLLHTIQTNDGPKLEHYYHGLYARKRQQGEWFALDEDDLRKIFQVRRVVIGVCGGTIRTQLYKGSPAYYCESCDRPRYCNSNIPSVSVTAGVYPHPVCMKPVKKLRPIALD